MKTNLRKVLLLAAGAAILSAVPFCSAQQDVSDIWQPSPATVPVTAGQGGMMWIPVPEAPHALTGEAREARQSSRAWQREAGPMYSVGNARIILPASR